MIIEPKYDRRRFCKTLAGLLVPIGFPAIVKAQPLSFDDQAFMAQASSGACAAGLAFASAWAAQVVTNGGAAPSAATQSVVATLQCGLITDGLDSKMIAWDLIVPDNFIAARTPQKAGDNGITPWLAGGGLVAGDLSINGFTGDGASKYLDSQQPIGGTRTAQNIGWFIYTSIAASTTNGRAFGCLNSVGANPALLLATHDNTTNSIGISGNLTNNEIITPTQGAGFYCDQRVSSTDHRLYYASSTTPYAQIGSTDSTAYNGVFPDARPFILALNQNGGPVLPSAETISAHGMTVGLSLSDGAKLFVRFQTARKALGGGFV